MYGHMKFPKIGGLHNVVKTLDHLAALHENAPWALDYRAKVKLHGTNMGIRIYPDGTLTAQSRNQDIDSGGMQFPLFVEANSDYLRALARPDASLVIFGEWAGPGVQKKVAANLIPDKAFFIFALIIRKDDERRLVFDPDEIAQELGDLPERFHIIPWFGEVLHLNFGDKPALSALSDTFNADVAEIDKSDPYMKSLFGVEGAGEGLVYFPLTQTDQDGFANCAFKVKGERHTARGGAKKARTSVPVSEDVLAFIETMVTPARVLQGAQELFGQGPYEKSGVGPLIKWVIADIRIEGQDELEASGLDFNAVARNIPAKVREYYFSEVEKI